MPGTQPEAAPQFDVDRLWAEFADPANERAFVAHLFRTVHAPETRINVGSAILAYLGLLLVDVWVVPPQVLPDAMVARLAAVGLFAMLFAVAWTPLLERVRPAIPALLAWGGIAHNLWVGHAVGGAPGIAYRYFTVVLLALPPLIGRCTVREALTIGGVGFGILQGFELVLGDGDRVIWLFLSATCAIGGAYGVYGAWIYHITARHDFWQARVIAWQLQQLDVERARSDRLLRNILPDAIASRLKAGERVIADSYPAVTVVFADLCGFTAYAATVSPERLVQRLDALFRRFDALAETHGLEKIKTIGDAYMVAAGLPEPVADHADRACRFGLAMHEAIAAINAEHGEHFAVRVGVHSGPVVAGVIGDRKFAYDLWGDTVNLASRMESHGVVGRVHVTPETLAALGPGWRFEPHGPIVVKGKGEMTTALLIGPPGPDAG